MSGATGLKPFFTYYGGKWRAAPKYPRPLYGRIVEPFAGSAGYSLRYAHKQVRLFDTNEKVVGLWRYLISVSADEIMRLPVSVDHVDDVPGPEEARWLIGFWMNKGSTGPCLRPSRWMRDGTRPGSYWGTEIRHRIASQVDRIRHWKAFLMPYDQADYPSSTWFIDPPYDSPSGRLYPQQFTDYKHLGEWSRTRPGQVIVCEMDGAAWLPFEPLGSFKSLEGQRGKGRVHEVIWTGDTP